MYELKVLSDKKSRIVFSVSYQDKLYYLSYKGISKCIVNLKDFDVIQDKAVINALVSSHNEVIGKLMNSGIFTDSPDSVKSEITDAYLFRNDS